MSGPETPVQPGPSPDPIPPHAAPVAPPDPLAIAIQNQAAALTAQTVVLERVANHFDRERHSESRWTRFKIFAIMIPLVLVAFVYSTSIAKLVQDATLEHVAVVRLYGPISADAEASALGVDNMLKEAFESKYSTGVVLLVNSPGGSPAQSMIIRAELDHLIKAHPEKKFVAVAEDTCASGAYLVASGAPKLYVTPATLVGSIGVIMKTINYHKLAQKYGVENVVLTAGVSKSRLDPMLPVSADDVKKMRDEMAIIHRQFIDLVKAGRGDRLKPNGKDLYTGDFWTGEEGVALGLADGIGTLNSVIEENFTTKTVKYYSQGFNWKSLIGEITGVHAMSPTGNLQLE